MELLWKLFKSYKSQYSEYNLDDEFLYRLIDVLVGVRNCRVDTVQFFGLSWEKNQYLLLLLCKKWNSISYTRHNKDFNDIHKKQVQANVADESPDPINCQLQRLDLIYLTKIKIYSKITLALETILVRLFKICIKWW